MTEIKFLPPAVAFLKQVGDADLKAQYRNAVDCICENELAGEPETGDLTGVYRYGFYYRQTCFELAYVVEHLEQKVIVVIAAGPRERFYEQLKYYGETGNKHSDKQAENGK